VDGDIELTLGNRHRPSFNGVFNHPTDVAVAKDGTIFVSDGYANALIHCFTRDGELRWSRGAPGRGRGEFITPHGILVDSNGRVLVADRENDRIQVLDQGGEYLDEWGGLYHPMDLASDSEGNVYVTEQVPRMSVFDLDGNLVGRCRTGRIAHSVSVDSRGDIYLAEMPDRITKLVRLV
jgi:DNA-binding beta-propeller fold protein YncE